MQTGERFKEHEQVVMPGRLRWKNGGAGLVALMLLAIHAASPGAAADVAAWQKFQALAGQAFQKGRYKTAEQMYSLAVQEAEKPGGDERGLSSCLNGLASVYCQLGKVADAQAAYQRSLAILDRVVGTDDPQVIPTLLDLASVYESQGSHALAEPLYDRAFAINEATFGKAHPAVARSLHRLALVKMNQGKLERAEEYFKRALTILEPGPEHGDLANCLEDYALLLKKTKRTASAFDIEGRVKAIRDRLSTPTSGQASSESNWSLALKRQSKEVQSGQTGEAQQVLDTLKINESGQTGALPTFSTLAAVYYNQSRYADAEPLYKQMIAIDEKSLGADHPGLAADLNNLALLYITEGRYAEAKPLLARALAIYEGAYGMTNELSLKARGDLASVDEHLGNEAEAEALLRTNLAASEKTYAQGSREVAGLLNNLGYLCYKRGQLNDAEAFYQQALTASEASLGPDSPLVAACLKDYASVLRKLGKNQQAEEMEFRATSILNRGSRG